MFRKIVYILGLVSLVALLGAAGVAGYLASKGTLNGDSLHAAVVAVTSQPAADDPATTQPATASQPHSSEGIYADAVSAEVENAEAARLEMMRRQLANEQSLLEAARVSLQRQQEQFQQKARQWEEDQKSAMVGAQQDGVQKELDYLSSIRASQALMLLRAKSDGEVAKILMAMETRKGKKIIELCKSTDEQEWVQRILELIRQQSNVQAQALTGG